MPEPDFERLATRLRSVDEHSLREIRAINELVASRLAASSDSAAVEAQRIHDLCSNAASRLRYMDARPTPKAIHAARWAAQYTYAILLGACIASAADCFGRAANSVFDEYKGIAGNELPGVIYFVRHNGREEIKIGFALEGNLKSRLRALRTASPNGLEVLLTIPGTKGTEADLHVRFGVHRIAANNEWFRPAPEIMEFIGSMVPNDYNPTVFLAWRSPKAAVPNVP